MTGMSARLLTFTLMVFAAVYAFPAQETQLTEQQMRDFLLKAEVLGGKGTRKGITGVLRLTLSDGNITHDASFQAIDEMRSVKEFDSGRREVNFRDSYKYNIAAYELALLLGLGDMMPVTVARNYRGKTGSLSWWLPVRMDEAERRRQKMEPPDREAWNRQIHRLRVFAQLVYDTDRNLGNVLISEDWHIWMIDFSRAFRIHHRLRDAKDLQKCDRQLLERLRGLNAQELAEKTKGYLSEREVEAIMDRRDKIVSVFETLVKERGEGAVLY